MFFCQRGRRSCGGGSGGGGGKKTIPLSNLFVVLLIEQCPRVCNPLGKSSGHGFSIPKYYQPITLAWHTNTIITLQQNSASTIDTRPGTYLVRYQARYSTT